MLQNALMWKVNQEFAHAQQTLDDIRCVVWCGVVWRLVLCFGDVCKIRWRTPSF